MEPTNPPSNQDHGPKANRKDKTPIDRRDAMRRIVGVGLSSLYVAGAHFAMASKAHALDCGDFVSGGVAADSNCGTPINQYENNGDSDCGLSEPGGEGGMHNDANCASDDTCGRANAAADGYFGDSTCAPGGGGDEDADCGLGVAQTNQAHGDGACSTALADGTYSSDSDCDQVEKATGALHSDANCGKPASESELEDDADCWSGNPGDDVMYDNECGKVIADERSGDNSCGTQVDGILNEDINCGTKWDNEIESDSGCGQQGGGMVDEDQSCIPDSADADCGKAVNVAAPSTADNYCNTNEPTGSGKYTGDSSCGQLAPGNELRGDASCGKTGIDDTLNEDADCGRAVYSHEAASQDADCGQKSGTGNERMEDNDCGKSTDGIEASPDNDCGLNTGGYDMMEDQDCGKTDPSGLAYADQDCGKWKSYPDEKYGDNDCNSWSWDPNYLGDQDCRPPTPSQPTTDKDDPDHPKHNDPNPPDDPEEPDLPNEPDVAEKDTGFEA